MVERKQAAKAKSPEVSKAEKIVTDISHRDTVVGHFGYV